MKHEITISRDKRCTICRDEAWCSGVEFTCPSCRIYFDINGNVWKYKCKSLLRMIYDAILFREFYCDCKVIINPNVEI